MTNIEAVEPIKRRKYKRKINTQEAATTYCIIRYYFDRQHESKIMQRGLTLEQAREHCHSDQTSSKTATTADAHDHTKRHGPWFDGYSEE